jgi:hypothetical protein
MGSIVKTIGKVVKKIGKALKKIAPILLVAAAAYVGYGYMTGFQSGGWPQITEWGKSLMGGVSQGQTLSQAANAAGGITDGGITTPLTDTTPIAEPISGAIDQTIQKAPSWDAEAAMSADPSLMTDAGGLLGSGDGMGLPSEGGLLSEIQENTNTRFNTMMDGFVDNMDSTNLGPSVSNYFMSDTPQSTMMQQFQQHAQGISGPGGAHAAAFAPGSRPPGSTVTPAVTPAVTQDVTPVASTSPNYLLGMGSGLGPDTGSAIGYNIPHINDPSAMSKIAGMGKKAWGFYKQMWEDNPGMAMWTTANVVKTIAALLDKSDEQESYRKRHVAGFAPGNWGDLRKQYGGNLPTSKPAGIWAGDSQRTASAKTGPKPAGGMRTSAIDRKPQGMIGSKVERAVA